METDMHDTLAERNKQMVLEAFDTLFNRKDYERASAFWAPGYIQHNPHFPDGRDGLFGAIKALPATARYEHQLAVAEGDYVMLHGRYSDNGQPANWMAVDVCRIEDGVLVEHWDVIQDEATKAESINGHPMFGDRFPPDRVAPPNVAEVAREIVKSFYDGAARGRITDFAECLADDFELFVPDYLPWGGHFDKAGYVALLPKIALALDFTRLSHLSLVADGGHVVALIEIGVQGTDKTIVISEHWDISNGKTTRLRVAYYDPTILLDQITANPE
jgi:predicted SnoaL-like aldol condensation-catalyzing enzyme/ketosteroid isomerase-like protein